MEKSHKEYLRNVKKRKFFILFFQILILVIFLGLWQIAANREWINSFITSSPFKIITTIQNLHNQGTLYHHIWITSYETILSFALGTFLGVLVAAILWWFEMLAKILEPYFTVLNSLPKVALGPIILIWFGANMKSIIFMAMLVSVIVAILNIYQGFRSVDIQKMKLMNSFKASKWQIFVYLVFPSNVHNVISTLKLNISMCLIGLLPPVGEKIFFNKCYSRYLFYYHLL